LNTRAIETTGELKLKLWVTMLRSMKQAPAYTHVNKILARMMFRVNAVSKINDHLWDETTLALKKAVKRYARDGQRILDLGAGHIGVLSVYLAKTKNVDIVAVDVNEQFVNNAINVAAASRAHRISFTRSDWWSEVDGRFDLIFCNVPYIPTEVGLKRNHETPHSEVWDGGADGRRHMRTVIRGAGDYLKNGGRLLLGVNTLYVEKEKCAELFKQAHNLNLEEIIKSRFSPSRVFVAGKTPTESYRNSLSKIEYNRG
jgi:release factor glutamine methyltransferase